MELTLAFGRLQHHYTQKVRPYLPAPSPRNATLTSPTQVDFASLKQTLELSEKTDFVNLKAENERLLGDIERLKQRLREEITRTQAGVRLDLNLEKVHLVILSRIRHRKLTLIARAGEDPRRAVYARRQASRRRHADRERDWTTQDLVNDEDIYSECAYQPFDPAEWKPSSSSTPTALPALALG
jgi:hypothetical protein